MQTASSLPEYPGCSDQPEAAKECWDGRAVTPKDLVSVASRRAIMTRAAIAGATYFAIVFACGFVFGTVRVLVLAPLLGTMAAVLVELPLIVTVAWLTCQRLTDWFLVPRRIGPGLMMGGVAFIMLMTAEASLSVMVFQKSLATFAVALTSLPGALGLAGQVAFGVFPLILTRPRAAKPAA